MVTFQDKQILEINPFCGGSSVSIQMNKMGTQFEICIKTTFHSADIETLLDHPPDPFSHSTLVVFPKSSYQDYCPFIWLIAPSPPYLVTLGSHTDTCKL